MGTYGYISIIAMVCYGFMLLMFLTAKRNKIVNSFLVVLVGLLFWAGGSAFIPAWNFTAAVCILLFYSGIWRSEKKSARENISGCYADLFCGKYPAWGIPGMPECGGKEWASYFCV